MPTTPAQTLSDRIALVTGASRGIGRAVAVELARRGAHVIALARSQGGLETLDDEIRGAGGSATLVPLDLKDFDALDRLSGAVSERWGRLDALVGNGGILGPLSPLDHVEPKAWDQVFAVNVTANWRLVRGFHRLLRASEAGRVALITSGAGHPAEANPYWGPYAASKAALDMLGRTYAAETRNLTNIRVMLASPGPLRTRMRAQAMPGEDPESLRAPEDFAPKVADLCEPAWLTTGKVYSFRRDAVLSFRAPEADLT